jgi:ubiquinone/menaquinone biosynthesis C-methylase UbiE
MKKKFFLKQIKINKEDTIKAYINNKIFTPNLTTNLLIEASKKLIMGDKKVLELGCGEGINLRIISKKNQLIELFGIDINKIAIQSGLSIINKFNLNIKLTSSNMKNLKMYKNNEFDIVFSDASLMYIGPNNIYKILKEALRVSRSKVFICEQHTNDKSFYNDKWVHNYKQIVSKIPSVDLIKVHKIKDDRKGDWSKFGQIIEVRKYI